MHEEELNTQRNHRSQDQHAEEGEIWHSEAFDIAKTRSEPVVEVCTAKCHLQCFQKEYTVHYKSMSVEEWEMVRNSRTK
jgi:hypothetical protein